MIEGMLNRVHHSDCLEGLRRLPDESIDVIVTSPPYWKGFEYEAYFNSYKQYLDWCEKWLKECKRVLKPTGTFYLNVINDSEITIRAFELMEIATRKVMFKLHDTIVWYRYNQQPANTPRQLTNKCEYIFMLRHTSANIDLHKTEAYERNPHIFETKNVGNVWRIPFNSGTTAVACVNTDRYYIGFDMSREYCEIAQKRLDEAIATKREQDEGK